MTVRLKRIKSAVAPLYTHRHLKTSLMLLSVKRKVAQKTLWSHFVQRKKANDCALIIVA